MFHHQYNYTNQNLCHIGGYTSLQSIYTPAYYDAGQQYTVRCPDSNLLSRTLQNCEMCKYFMAQREKIRFTQDECSFTITAEYLVNGKPLRYYLLYASHYRS